MYKNIATQSIGHSTFAEAGIAVDVLRLDLIHPHISGNKLFKLKYHLAQALDQGKKGIVSFGGPYSNHLVALAFACMEKGLRSMAVIRGEKPPSPGHSLGQMEEFGMELVYTDRETYRRKEIRFDYEETEWLVVPEGGGGINGIMGASEIMLHAERDYSHIVCAVGTGTTVAGIINGSRQDQRVIGISSLKVADPANNALLRCIQSNTQHSNYELLFDYHRGGYAKKDDELVHFMNHFYRSEGIPTDFVYTAKVFFAVYDLAAKGYFEKGANLLVIHSGGLQGNRSLPKGTLDF